MTELANDAEKRYARVLMFMHWAMHQPEGKKRTFGELLRLGCDTCRMPYPPPEVERGLLFAALKLSEVPFTTEIA